MAIRKTKSAVLEVAQPKRRKLIKGMTQEEVESAQNESAPESESVKAEVAVVVQKPKREPKNDTVASTLAKCEKPKEMVESIKAHKSFAFINEEAFKRTVKSMKETPVGLFRMRLGNLFRGALKKMETSKG